MMKESVAEWARVELSVRRGKTHTKVFLSLRETDGQQFVLLRSDIHKNSASVDVVCGRYDYLEAARRAMDSVVAGLVKAGYEVSLSKCQLSEAQLQRAARNGCLRQQVGNMAKEDPQPWFF